MLLLILNKDSTNEFLIAVMKSFCIRIEETVFLISTVRYRCVWEEVLFQSYIREGETDLD